MKLVFANILAELAETPGFASYVSDPRDSGSLRRQEHPLLKDFIRKRPNVFRSR